MAYLDCLHTVVKNMTGVKTYFGFLPPHGVTLQNGAEYSVRGDLNTVIAVQKDQDRAWPSWENALDNTEIVIVHSPAIYIYDLVNDAVQTLVIKNRVISSVEPAWGHFSESGSHSYAGG